MSISLNGFYNILTPQKERIIELESTALEATTQSFIKFL